MKANILSSIQEEASFSDLESANPDALNIKVFTRVCSDNLNCKTYENNQDLVPELTKQILKTATLYKKQKLEKTKDKNKDLVIN